MIKKIFGALLLLMLSMTAWAQTAESNIALTPVLPEGLDLPADAEARLKNKMMQMVTQNNFGSTSGDFILTANLAVVDKQVTATVPAQYIVELELSFYVLGVEEEVIVKEFSQVVRGMGRTEQKAYIGAINMVTSRSPQVRNFMTSAREKMVEYYAQHVSKMIAKAQSLSDRGEYEQAVAVLAAIPECVEEYPIVQERMTKFYVAMVDKYAEVALREARAKMAERNYRAAMDELVAVDPASTHFEESLRIVEEVKQAIDAAERAKLEHELRLAEANRAAKERMQSEQPAEQRQRIQANAHVNKTQAEIAEKRTKLSEVTDWINRLLGR